MRAASIVTPSIVDNGWFQAIDSPYGDRFSGAFVWNYDFDLPLMSGGYTPTLRLSYNSRRIDGLLSWVQSDWAGLGFRVDPPEITWRNLARADNGLDQLSYLRWDPALTLVMDGESLELWPDASWPNGWQYGEASGGCGSYTHTQYAGSFHTRVETERFWRMRWLSDDSREVTLKDGTRYLFGSSLDSRQVTQGWLGGAGACAVITSATVRWRLKTIVYPTGATIQYDYDKQTFMDQCSALGPMINGETCPNGIDVFAASERASYLRSISYAGVRVLFNRAVRWNLNGPNDGSLPQAYRWDYGQGHQIAYFWQTDALQSVTLQRQRVTGEWLTQREWRFTYGSYRPVDAPEKQLRILTMVQDFAYLGSTWQARPAIVFTYAGLPDKDICNCIDQGAWGRARFFYPRLTGITDPGQRHTVLGYTSLDSGNQAWNYRVVYRSVQSDLPEGWFETYSYSDSPRTRCYLASIDSVTCNAPMPVAGGLFLGYQEVTVSRYELSGTLAQRVRTLYAMSTRALWGRLVVQEEQQADSTALRRTSYSWAVNATHNGVAFVALMQHDEQYAPTWRTVRQTYSYDDFGNVASELDYGFVDTNGDERRVERGVVANMAQWIVDKPAWEDIYAGVDATASLHQQTKYLYDGAVSSTVAPVHGRLTQVTSGLGTVWATEQKAYDAWGNVVIITGANGAPTNIDYDSLAHSLVVATTNALGHTARREYYGINESDSLGTGPIGALKREIDPNGAVTSYSYDGFGQVTTQVRPGDSDTIPTTQWEHDVLPQHWSFVDLFNSPIDPSDRNHWIGEGGPILSIAAGQGRN